MQLLQERMRCPIMKISFPAVNVQRQCCLSFPLLKTANLPASAVRFSVLKQKKTFTPKVLQAEVFPAILPVFFLFIVHRGLIPSESHSVMKALTAMRERLLTTGILTAVQ